MGASSEAYLAQTEREEAVREASAELLEALRAAQSALAVLIAPAEIRATTTQQAWAQCVAAEAGARAAIAAAERR
jgi:hypothetical protein